MCVWVFLCHIHILYFTLYHFHCEIHIINYSSFLSITQIFLSFFLSSCSCLVFIYHQIIPNTFRPQHHHFISVCLYHLPTSFTRYIVYRSFIFTLLLSLLPNPVSNTYISKWNEIVICTWNHIYLSLFQSRNISYFTVCDSRMRRRQVIIVH